MLYMTGGRVPHPLLHRNIPTQSQSVIQITSEQIRDGRHWTTTSRTKPDDGSAILRYLTWLTNAFSESVDENRSEEATAIIRRIRPDILVSVDPGEWYERWHKTDHRMAAFNTIDAVRAAEFWLYFPNQKLQQGLQPYKVPEMYFFYPSPQEANYYVNIDSVADLKLEAAAKQVSQFEPAINKYRPDWEPVDLEKAKKEMRSEQPKKDGHYVEAFRYATGFVEY